MDRTRDLSKQISGLHTMLSKTMGSNTKVKLIADTNEHVGPFCAITALTTAAVDVSECDMSFIEGVADFTITAGTTIYGKFQSIELDSGSILAYYE
jgi:hypothetical protein|tara:strand:- start:2720 stop:3007 length:288 start_codon:yes stop_codon:yes gene_type:complete